jgi:regulator of replication initiation timing
MQEAPKELLNELQEISNQNLILKKRNEALQLETEQLRKLLHHCTCIPVQHNNGDIPPIEKL